jgi:hypothetical protein
VSDVSFALLGPLMLTDGALPAGALVTLRGRP